MMKKYEGTFDKFFSKTIYLNVNHLEKGEYTLTIVHKDKVIKTTHFKRE
ncbi:MAG: hypothetical protein R2781_07730 [Flavobacteriaceae bacterium]